MAPPKDTGGVGEGYRNRLEVGDIFMPDTEGRYTRIKSRFWSDEKVVAWDNDTKLLALYLLTSPHNNILGCYVLPKLYICADLEWSTERLDKPFQKLLDDGYIKYDNNCRLLFITNYLAHNPISNGNQATGAGKQLREIPKSPLLQELKRSIERLDKPFLKPLLEQIGDPVTVTVDVTVDHKDICAPNRARKDAQKSKTSSANKNNGQAASQDPGGSVEAEKVTATPDEQRARKPFKNKKQETMFDQFWDMYPKKRSKGQAEKTWVKIDPDESLLVAMLSGLEKAKNSHEWTKEGGQYVPYPSTWLNAKGWEDEYSEVNSDEDSRGDPGRDGYEIPEDFFWSE